MTKEEERNERVRSLTPRQLDEITRRALGSTSSFNEMVDNLHINNQKCLIYKFFAPEDAFEDRRANAEVRAVTCPCGWGFNCNHCMWVSGFSLEYIAGNRRQFPAEGLSYKDFGHRPFK